MYRSGRFPLDNLITRYPFDQLNQAVADTVAGTTVKPVLLF
jgi:aryl-alcohol dehydrogenase